MKSRKYLKNNTYDFAARENKSGLDTEEKELVEFWKENLKDSPVELKFPYDYSRKSSFIGLGYREPFLISDIATRKLRALTKKKDSTVFKTMLSVLGVLFQKYTSDYDICIGIPVSNRRASSSEKEIFGMLVTTSVVRLKIQPETNFIDLISYTKDVANKAIENSLLPFEKIVEAVNPLRTSNMNPLFQIALSWWNDVTIPMELNGIKGKRINVPDGVSPFDLTFYIWENENTIEGEIEYSSDLLKPETILRFKNHLLNLVNNLVENSETAIESLSMISDEEKKDDL